MAEPFDPDAYLAEKEGAQAFDPDAYLSEKEDPGAGGAGALGLANALSLAGVPNVFAAQDALRHLGEGDLIENFKKARTAHQQRMGEINAAHPVAAVGGALGTLLVGGNPQNIVQMGVAPALQAGLQSDALVEGRPIDAAKEAALGFGIGAGAGALAEGAGALASRASGLGPAIERKIAGATADEAAAQWAKAAKAANSARGALGGEVAAARNALEVARETIASPSADVQQKVAAATWLKSPEAIALERRVFENNLAAAPGRMGAINTAEGVRDVANAAKEPAAIEKATEEGLASPIKTQVVPRLKTIASRAIPALVGPAVGQWVGGEVGGDEGRLAGMAIGGAAGLGTAMVMGRPGTAMANMARSPAVRKMWWEGVQSVLKSTPQLLGRFAGVLGSALARSPAEFATTSYLLQSRDPEFRKLTEELEENGRLGGEE